MFNKFDNNCCFNHLHTIIKVSGDINEVVNSTLYLCKNFLAMQCELLVDEPDAPVVLIISGVRYNCKRVCDLTGNTLEFVMEFLTFDEESTNVIRCTHWYGEKTYQFFKKTITMLQNLIEKNVNSNSFIEEDVTVLHPLKSKLEHTLREGTCVDPHAYSECHPGLYRPLTPEQFRQEWEIIKMFFDGNSSDGICAVKSNALKGIPVPLEILDMVLSCDVTIDLIICLIAIFTNNPLIPYECHKVEYPFDDRYNHILTEASQKDELCRRQVARLLYAWKIRDITYGHGIDVKSDCLHTKCILDLIL